MPARFHAFWEESIDGLLNCGILFVTDRVWLDSDDDDMEQSPLAGAWDSKESMLKVAAKLGIPVEEIEFEE